MLTSENQSQDPVALENKDDLITFILDGTHFGIRISEVSEVIKQIKFTRVLRAPASVIGIMNLRGKLVTLVDLREKLGLARGAADLFGMAIIVNDNDESFGLEVGVVGDIISAGALAESSDISISNEPWRRYCSSMKWCREGLIVVLDLKKLLTFEE